MEGIYLFCFSNNYFMVKDVLVVLEVRSYFLFIYLVFSRNRRYGFASENMHAELRYRFTQPRLHCFFE